MTRFIIGRSLYGQLTKSIDNHSADRDENAESNRRDKPAPFAVAARANGPIVL